MTLTLAQARDRVRLLVDDPAPGVRFLDADIDNALADAQAEAWDFAAGAGVEAGQVQGSATTSSLGVASLTSLSPLKITSVQLIQSSPNGFRINIPALRARDATQPYLYAATLLLTYVPKVTFPASSGASFVWGSASVSLPQLDKYMVVIAASELKIVDNEVLPGLENRKRELKEAVQGICNVPQWAVTPVSPSRQPSIRYTITGPDQMQLVWG